MTPSINGISFLDAVTLMKNGSKIKLEEEISPNGKSILASHFSLVKPKESAGFIPLRSMNGENKNHRNDGNSSQNNHDERFPNLKGNREESNRDSYHGDT